MISNHPFIDETAYIEALGAELRHDECAMADDVIRFR